MTARKHRASGEPSRDVTLFEATPALRHPVRFLHDLGRDVGIILDLAPQMAQRQLVARYRRSVLGYLWLLVVPLSTAAAWLFVRSSGAIALEPGHIAYPLYIITGLFLWQGFLRMLNAPLQQVNASRAIIAKIRTPWEAVIAAGWLEALFEFAIVVIVLLFAIPLLGGSLGLGIIQAMVPMAMLLVLGAAGGLLLVPLGLLFDDVPRAVAVATGFLFFLTPIVYVAPISALGRVVFRLNPVAVLLDATRAKLIGDVVTAPGLTIVWGIIGLGGFVVGWIAMRVSTPHLVARL